MEGYNKVLGFSIWWKPKKHHRKKVKLKMPHMFDTIETFVVQASSSLKHM